MNITLLRIEPAEAVPAGLGQRRVRICIEVDGVPEWHEVRVQSDWLPQSGAGLIEAGDSLRAQDVHLPELVAA